MDEWHSNFEKNPSKYNKVIDWNLDRAKSDYFVEKMNNSGKFEFFIEEEFKKEGIDIGFFYDKNQFSGENKLGIEIKNDIVFKKTRNIYIEYQERLNSQKDWVDSGILKKDNTEYFLVGCENEYYIFLKKDLVLIYETLKNKNLNGCRFVEEKLNKTSKGFVMNIDFFSKIAITNNIKTFSKILKTKNINFNYSEKDIYKYIHLSDCKFLKKDYITKENSFELISKGFKLCTHCFEKK